jgi:hypothetical protein
MVIMVKFVIMSKFMVRVKFAITFKLPVANLGAEVKFMASFITANLTNSKFILGYFFLLVFTNLMNSTLINYSINFFNFRVE